MGSITDEARLVLLAASELSTPLTTELTAELKAEVTSALAVAAAALVVRRE